MTFTFAPVEKGTNGSELAEVHFQARFFCEHYWKGSRIFCLLKTLFLVSGDLRKLVNCLRLLILSHQMMTDWNKAPIGIQDDKHVNSTFLVIMRFYLGSLGSWLDRGWCVRKGYVKFKVFKRSKSSNLGSLEILGLGWINCTLFLCGFWNVKVQGWNLTFSERVGFFVRN